MDEILDDFLDDDDSHGHPPKVNTNDSTTKTKRRKGGRAEGVWISVKGINHSTTLQNGNDIRGIGDENAAEGGEVDEMDEMIWWAWDAGKIIGFSDW
jgi:hypothetical protein